MTWRAAPGWGGAHRARRDRPPRVCARDGRAHDTCKRASCARRTCAGPAPGAAAAPFDDAPSSCVRASLACVRGASRTRRMCVPTAWTAVANDIIDPWPHRGRARMFGREHERCRVWRAPRPRCARPERTSPRARAIVTGSAPRPSDTRSSRCSCGRNAIRGPGGGARACSSGAVRRLVLGANRSRIGADWAPEAPFLVRPMTKSGVEEIRRTADNSLCRNKNTPTGRTS